jgi:hypothetical protein
VKKDVKLPHIQPRKVEHDQHYRLQQTKRATEMDNYRKEGNAITQQSKKVKAFWSDGYIGSPKHKSDERRRKNRAMKVEKAEKTFTQRSLEIEAANVIQEQNKKLWLQVCESPNERAVREEKEEEERQEALEKAEIARKYRHIPKTRLQISASVQKNYAALLPNHPIMPPYRGDPDGIAEGDRLLEPFLAEFVPQKYIGALRVLWNEYINVRQLRNEWRNAKYSIEHNLEGGKRLAEEMETYFLTLPLELFFEDEVGSICFYNFLFTTPSNKHYLSLQFNQFHE